jgi:chaperonin GroEL
MITDAEKRLAILEDCHVLVTDIPLSDMTQIGKFLEEQIFPNTKKVLFITPEVGDGFVTPLLGAKLQGAFLGVAMRSPGIAHIQTETLQDIAALTGATFITKAAGHKFDDFAFKDLGQAHRIIMSNIATIIEGGGGPKNDILQRIASIKGELADETNSDYEREQLHGRLGRLTSGVAVIKVGGQTEVEMKERKERVFDAVASTQSAIKHGFVPGGEIVYLNALSVLDDKILGEKILKEALKEPFRRLVTNAGYSDGEKLAGMHERPATEGFDVTDGVYKDMIKAGIIDSAAISQTAVKTAVSVAIQLATLGSATVYKNQE